MKFTKMHGAGNDYLYIDARDHDDFSTDWSQLSRSMSDRHFGVGSDGIILIEDSGIADLKMRMFNADGSESEMCGNGIRCFAKYAIDRGLATPGSDGIEVETLAGIRTVIPIYDGDRITGARVAMGEPLLEPGDVPVILDPASGYPKGPVTGYPLALDSLETAPVTVVGLDQVQERFHELHLSLHGHSARDQEIELVSYRVRVRVPVPKQALPEIPPRGDILPANIGNRRVTFDGHNHFDAPVYTRDDLTSAPLQGPLIIEQFDSTTVLPSGWTATLDKYGNIIIGAHDDRRRDPGI